jgi:hypothetical protein
MSKAQIDFDGLRMVLDAGKAAPPDTLDMGEWSCGTTACLVGNFCLTHPRDPLKLIPHPQSPAIRVPILGVVHDGPMGMDAVRKRFGLSDDDAIYLFGLGHPEDDVAGGGADLSPAEAIARLESFINSGGRR